MYIAYSRSGYRGTEQVVMRAPFLILMQQEGWNLVGNDQKIRGIVRKVALHQCGHWMMGSAFVKRHRIAISGSYGNDGLPCSVPKHVWEQGVELPAELHEAWNKGGGWNGAGSEAPLMREWGRSIAPQHYGLRP